MSAAAPVAHQPVSAGDRPLRFGGCLVSEWRKASSLLSSRWIVGLSLLAIVAIGPLISLANVHSDDPSTDINSLTQIALLGVHLAQLSLGVFAILTVSNEYGTGMIRASLTSNPRRYWLLASKMIVIGSFVFVTTLVSCLIAFLWSRSIDNGAPAHLTFSFSSGLANGLAPMSLAHDGGLRAVIFGALFLTLLAVMVQGLAWIIRNTAGSIGLFAGILLVAPAVLALVPVHFLNVLGDWTPGEVGADMTSAITQSGSHSPGVACLIMIGWAVVAMAVGGQLLQRRDA